MRLRICDSHLTYKVTNKCLNFLEWVEVIEWNRRWSSPLPYYPVNFQCLWKKTLIEKKTKLCLVTMSAFLWWWRINIYKVLSWCFSMSFSYLYVKTHFNSMNKNYNYECNAHNSNQTLEKFLQKSFKTKIKALMLSLGC